MVAQVGSISSTSRCVEVGRCELGMYAVVAWGLSRALAKSSTKKYDAGAFLDQYLGLLKIRGPSALCAWLSTLLFAWAIELNGVVNLRRTSKKAWSSVYTVCMPTPRCRSSLYTVATCLRKSILFIL